MIFVPGGSACGAQYINLLALLARSHPVDVLNPRNQGLSPHVEYGGRTARYSMDLKEFGDHIAVKSADYVVPSMRAAILWRYIDLFGTGIKTRGEILPPLVFNFLTNLRQKEEAYLFKGVRA